MNSFVAGTQVLMEDGSAKPIERVRPGDRVMAGDPDADTSTGQEVAATIVGDGAKDLIDITVEGADDVTATITATDGHPFWVDHDGDTATLGGRWIDAAQLRHGQWLKTADGRLIEPPRIFRRGNQLRSFSSGRKRGMSMARQRRTFTPEYKDQVARMV
ncbi:Hint domain-containing protein, partial [Paractinoplanes hotanensis]